LPEEAPGSPPLPLGEILTAARSSRIIDAITAIRKLTAEGHLRSATEEAFYALQFAPTYLPLHTYLGELLIQQGRVPEAINKFMVISQTYNARGEVERSIDVLRKVVELAPMDLNARSRLIDLLIEHGQTNEAITEYQEMAGVYYNLADLAKSRKTYTEALRLAQQANADRAVKAEILYQMADIDLQSLDWRQALRIYEQLRTLQPEDKRARFNIIELNLRLGQESQAISELNNYLSYLSNRGERRQIFTFLEELVREIPDQAAVRRPLAEAYRQIGRKEDAISQYDAIGEIYLDRGNRPAALQAIETILRLEPKDKEQYQQLLENIKGT
jgi:tetratricopeptide (TPR) repeat protein